MGLRVLGIVVHCSASVFGDAREINSWHEERGWSEIGYHKVILNGWRKPELRGGSYDVSLDGKIEQGREDWKVGAQCLAGGMNEVSLGVCLIGYPGKKVAGATSIVAGRGVVEAYVTERQWESLIDALARLCRRYKLDPLGSFEHRDRRPFVLSQHSDHDRGKPFCASLNMDVVRVRVADRMRELK